MKVVHRVTFGHKDNVLEFLEDNKIQYQRTPLPNNGFLLHIDIEETNSDWQKIADLAEEKRAPDVFSTLFSDDEIRAADWIRLVTVREQGYPQPEGTMKWMDEVYRGVCKECGAGYEQIAPFKMREPKMGKYDFMSLYWTYTVFCIGRVTEALAKHGINGYETWEAINYKTKQPISNLSQLVVKSVTEPGLLDADELHPVTCKVCGLTKHDSHLKGFMRYKKSSLPTNTDFVLANEWFGSGHFAFRELLISNRVAQLILDEGWKGVQLKPIIAV